MTDAELIAQFIDRYRREIDFYETAAALAQARLESGLETAGVRAIVTSRAKRIDRLQRKLEERVPEKKLATLDDVSNDIVDLAGVRVALYFPGDQRFVEQFINATFHSEKPKKDFPSEAQESIETIAGTAFRKRFAGYRASHYLVTLRDESLTEEQKRYALARIEIQVASVLMHAWAEVEHDLIYKPQHGLLSEDEHAILDELNGLVMAGEISLERLQSAIRTRIATSGRPFGSHYDLAAHLYEWVERQHSLQLDDSMLGNVEILFEFLRRLETGNPKALQEFLRSVAADFEKRPLADQIVDLLLAEDQTRYAVYAEIRDALRLGGSRGRDANAFHKALGRFLANWIELEQLVVRAWTERGLEPRWQGLPSARSLSRLGVTDTNVLGEVEQLRSLRNQVIHGIEFPSPDLIDKARSRLAILLARIKDLLQPTQ